MPGNQMLRVSVKVDYGIDETFDHCENDFQTLSAEGKIISSQREMFLVT